MSKPHQSMRELFVAVFRLHRGQIKQQPKADQFATVEALASELFQWRNDLTYTHHPNASADFADRVAMLENYAEQYHAAWRGIVDNYATTTNEDTQ